MEQRTFHGNLLPKDIAQALLADLNQGNLRAQVFGDDDHMTVQIATAQRAHSVGKTALAVDLQKIPDGVSVQIGEQQWLGVAADLGETALAALINPWNLVGRLGNIAQDVQSLQLNDRVWEVINQVLRSTGASLQLSERLSRITCDYCGTANPVGEPDCIACGAPLGKIQPKTCTKCGFVLVAGEKFCPNCGQAT